MIACGLCLIWLPSFVKNYSACCPKHSVYVCFNRLISCIENKFKLTTAIRRRFPLWRIFLNILTLSPISVITQRFILSAIDLFFDFGYFFYKDFFAFCKVFSTSHTARGIIELIAWIITFLEERLDFEITSLIYSVRRDSKMWLESKFH